MTTKTTDSYVAEQQIRTAMARLMEARELLKSAGAHRAVDRVRSALKSADGARRHAISRRYQVEN